MAHADATQTDDTKIPLRLHNFQKAKMRNFLRRMVIVRSMF
jgi:hypothetical protein